MPGARRARDPDGLSDCSAGVALTQFNGERTIYDNSWVRLVQVHIEPLAVGASAIM